MSEKKKTAENTEQKEKVVTKYDQKMQRRATEKAKAKKQERISAVIGVIVVVALAAFIASFPIRTYLATHETYVRINGKDITRVEFDFNYHLAKDDYINTYSAYMSYFGFDKTGDLSTQMYSDTLSWKDFFEKQAVDVITQNMALKTAAEAEGFVYDTTEDYAEYEQALQDAASASGVTVKQYIQNQYGPYATKARIEGFIKESMYLNAFYEKVTEEKSPTEEELKAHYDEDPDLYDSVDYHIATLYADFASEATEEEIEKAMASAKVSADSTSVMDEELVQGGRWNNIPAEVREWLYDTSRKAGDTTVIEDEDNYCYYAVGFEKRYLDETPTVDARVLITSTEDGQALLDEWKNGEATEESFAELCNTHSNDTSADGGLYETLVKTNMDKNLADWLFDSARQTGDTVSIVGVDGASYVMYFVGTDAPEWQLDAKNNVLLPAAMSAYMEEIKGEPVIEDPNGKLNYLKIEAEAAQSSESAETATDSSAAANEK